MDPTQFADRIRVADTQEELNSLRIDLQDELNDVGDILGQAKADVIRTGKYMPAEQFRLLESQRRRVGTQMQRVQLKLTALRQDRHEWAAFEQHFVDIARELLPPELFKDLTRQARERLEKVKPA